MGFERTPRDGDDGRGKECAEHDDVLERDEQESRRSIERHSFVDPVQRHHEPGIHAERDEEEAVARDE